MAVVRYEVIDDSGVLRMRAGATVIASALGGGNQIGKDNTVSSVKSGRDYLIHTLSKSKTAIRWRCSLGNDYTIRIASAHKYVVYDIVRETESKFNTINDILDHTSRVSGANSAVIAHMLEAGQGTQKPLLDRYIIKKAHDTRSWKKICSKYEWERIEKEMRDQQRMRNLG
jgi:hypothetical protein